MDDLLQLSLIDISALTDPSRIDDIEGQRKCAQEIDHACRTSGFFRVKGHGVPVELQKKLDRLSREFFDMSDEVKSKVKMEVAGSAWRGWFPVGGELTSGKPDNKEGLYCGQELSDDHPKVLGVAMGLGMPADWFAENICKEPTELFRVFHYPPPVIKEGEHPGWGVGEHTDYGLITLLAQDDCGGLQVKLKGDNWIQVPAEENVFVINIGDMLDRLTEGRYRSTPHRVLNASGRQRLSFPFFVDPSWDAEVTPLPLGGSPPGDDGEKRWDRSSVHAWTGKYGDYLTLKVSKCFPELFSDVTSNAE